MDIKELSSFPPKPWFIVSGPNLNQQASNGVNINLSTPSSSLSTPVDLTPSGANLAGSTGCAESLCVPGMTYRIRVYTSMNAPGGGARGRFYIAQDAAGTIPLTPATSITLSGSPVVGPIPIDFDIVYKQVGAAGVCVTVGSLFFPSLDLVNLLTNTTTASTVGGVSLHFIVQWDVAGVNTCTLVGYTSERLY